MCDNVSVKSVPASSEKESKIKWEKHCLYPIDMTKMHDIKARETLENKKEDDYKTFVPFFAYADADIPNKLVLMS
ncbi:hypothetical protein XELAEV_18029465mg [Xenopus laevis]|uniref:Uncharacterized protein n=1 Tax=Xenopus laevis TaxID=8355 RepID=A0A974CTX5_XENLA|nr:hypothetical protein XELAEV_18029465mg [Xenopus laevis]